MNLSSSVYSALRLTMIAGVMLFGSGIARAEVINVDFNSTFSNPNPTPTYSGVGAAPGSGTVWNGFNITAPTQTLSNLVNSTGGATTVSVTQSLFGIADSPADLGAGGNSARDLLRDFITTNTTPRTVTLNGLTTGTNYSLYLYGVGETAAGTGGRSRTSFTVGGLTQSTLGPVSSTITPNLTLGEDYVFFDNLMATNNALVITYAAPVGESFGVFNGLQLVTAPVPEPSTYAMMFLGVGALGLMTWKRKRSERTEADFAAAAI